METRVKKYFHIGEVTVRVPEKAEDMSPTRMMRQDSGSIGPARQWEKTSRKFLTSNRGYRQQ